MSPSSLMHQTRFLRFLHGPFAVSSKAPKKPKAPKAPKALTESRRYSPSESESLRESVSTFAAPVPIDPDTVEGRYLRSIGEDVPA